MGMYDEIICEYPLPDGFDATGVVFQTKDLACAMDVYTITKEGRLIHHYREWEATPESDLRPRTGTWRDVIGCIREVAGSQKLVDTNHHGFVCFYGGTREYSARFTRGVVEKVWLESDDSKGAPA